MALFARMILFALVDLKRSPKAFMHTHASGSERYTAEENILHDSNDFMLYFSMYLWRTYSFLLLLEFPPNRAFPQRAVRSESANIRKVEKQFHYANICPSRRIDIEKQNAISLSSWILFTQWFSFGFVLVHQCCLRIRYATHAELYTANENEHFVRVPIIMCAYNSWHL